MFTGIITDVGRVRNIEQRGDTRFTLETSYDTGTVEIGASIACSGPCMTVVEKGDGWFSVEASAETLSCTTMGSWSAGDPINLERAMCLGDELGGHIVSGHIDGLACVLDMRAEGDSVRFELEAPEGFSSYIAPKGSVALDGVSLTVNDVSGTCFGVNIIRHTQENTTFAGTQVGDRVNFEVDMLARYVARLIGEGKRDRG